MRPDEITRYQGRIGGLFDVDVESFDRGDVVMAVVVLKADSLRSKDNTRGECIGTVGFVVNDFVLIDDPILRKSITHHFAQLEPFEEQEQLAVEPQRMALPASEIGIGPGEVEEDYHELPETVIDVEDISDDDIVVADSDDGEVFSPSDESRERGRLGAHKDPVLQRFLRGE